MVENVSILATACLDIMIVVGSILPLVFPLTSGFRCTIDSNVAPR